MLKHEGKGSKGRKWPEVKNNEFLLLGGMKGNLSGALWEMFLR